MKTTEHQKAKEDLKKRAKDIRSKYRTEVANAVVDAWKEEDEKILLAANRIFFAIEQAITNVTQPYLENSEEKLPEYEAIEPLRKFIEACIQATNSKESRAVFSKVLQQIIAITYTSEVFQNWQKAFSVFDSKSYDIYSDMDKECEREITEAVAWKITPKKQTSIQEIQELIDSIK